MMSVWLATTGKQLAVYWVDFTARDRRDVVQVQYCQRFIIETSSNALIAGVFSSNKRLASRWTVRRSKSIENAAKCFKNPVKAYDGSTILTLLMKWRLFIRPYVTIHDLIVFCSNSFSIFAPFMEHYHMRLYTSSPSVSTRQLKCRAVDRVHFAIHM